MELVIGASYQEKLYYVLERTGYTKEDVYDSSIFYQTLQNGDANYNHTIIIENQLPLILQKPVFYQFHLFIKGLLTVDIDPTPIVESILSNHPEVIIIADEIGSGVVPMLPFDRRYRETTGRILCNIARKALKVHRVALGIGTIIKE